MTELNQALRNLRHLYEQMLDGRVRPSEHDIANAARGLLGPAIEQLERVQREVQELQDDFENLKCDYSDLSSRSHDY